MGRSDQFGVAYRRLRAEVVVDLARVSFIDSSGLAVLVRAREALTRKGGRLVLAGPTASARKVLEDQMEIRSVTSDA